MIAVAAGALTLAAPAGALAADLFVDDSGSDANPCNTTVAPCRTIGVAIGKAGTSDTIRIGGGTYNEEVALGDMISLLGDDFLGGGSTAGAAIVEGSDTTGGAGNDPTIAVVSGDPATEIRNLTIRGADYSLDLDDAVDVVGNTFDTDAPLFDIDVLVTGTAAPRILNNTFDDPTPGAFEDHTAIQSGTGGDVEVTGNVVDGYSRGIGLLDTSGAAAVTVVGNTVTGTHTGSGSGIAIELQRGPAKADIRENVIKDPGAGGSSIGISIRQNNVG